MRHVTLNLRNLLKITHNYKNYGATTSGRMRARNLLVLISENATKKPDQIDSHGG